MTEKKILIVEDEAIISYSLSAILKKQGYAVDTAKTGKDALAKVQKSYYNLLLLDIGLPDIKGTELLEKIRSSNRDTLVIMITGHPGLDSSIDSINEGADGYLVKPVREKDLVDIVKRKLRQQDETQTLSDEKVAEYLKSKLSRQALEKADKSVRK